MVATRPVSWARNIARNVLAGVPSREPMGEVAALRPGLPIAGIRIIETEAAECS